MEQVVPFGALGKGGDLLPYVLRAEDPDTSLSPHILLDTYFDQLILGQSVQLLGRSDVLRSEKRINNVQDTKTKAERSQADSACKLRWIVKEICDLETLIDDQRRMNSMLEGIHELPRHLQHLYSRFL